MIRELEALLPNSQNPNFRERLVERLEELERLKSPAGQENGDMDFQLKAKELLMVYEKVFGVKDVVDQPDEV
jgi:hypothetical protein